MFWFLVGLVPVGLLVLLLVFKGFFFVSQAQAAVIERLGSSTGGLQRLAP